MFLLFPILELKFYETFMQGSISVRLVVSISVDRGTNKKCPFSGITDHGGVWIKDTGTQGLECGLVAVLFPVSVLKSFEYFTKSRT